MIEYTAIYSTDAVKGICYSFKADSVQAAINFASSKFHCFPMLAIIANCPSCSDAACGRLVFLNGEIIV